MLLKKIALTSALVLTASAAFADCTISGNVSIIGNDFPAIQTVGAAASECTGGEVKTNLTADHQTLNLPGMLGNPAEYTSAIVANSSIIALMNEGVIRSLDDLVAKHGQGLKKSQLITIDGKVMAVAFMANAQHLMYRADVLEQIGVGVPSTYEEMLAAAEMIRSQGIMENPIGGPFKSGWNLAQEFNNMYIGMGGDFFKSGTAEVSINNAKGVATLEMLKSLSEYMNPDFLTHDSTLGTAEFQAGNVALMSMWGSRAATLTSMDGVTQAVKDGAAIAGALTVGGGNIPATTLWWDGWTIAQNISDADAEATFIAMTHAISPGILNDETSPQAVWLIDGYEATDASSGVIASADAGALPYPMVPFQGLLHTALGAELNDFMQGKEDAATALADIEAAYNAAAKEKGFL